LIYHILNNQIVELTADYIEYIYSKYIPTGSLLVTNGQSLDNIVIPSEVTHIVFDDASNPIDVIQHLDSININRPFSVVSGLYHLHQRPDPRIQFFPFWTVWMSSPVGRYMSMPTHHFSEKTKKYKFSCLNGTYWNHRILTYLKLTNKSYFKDMIFTFGNRPYHDDNLNELRLTENEKQQFNLLEHTVKFLTDERNDIDLSIDHPAYQETYVNLVTETNIRRSTPMLSEKTFKPIVAGQLFILIASPGAVQFLRDIGIDTFDDIIDHYYDTVIDPRSRIDLALDQIDQLDHVDLKSIYDQIRPRLIKNSEYFLSQEFRNQFSLNFG
jgi:hypothetical protein